MTFEANAAGSLLELLLVQGRQAEERPTVVGHTPSERSLQRAHRERHEALMSAVVQITRLCEDVRSVYSRSQQLQHGELAGCPLPSVVSLWWIEKTSYKSNMLSGSGIVATELEAYI